MCRNHLKTLVSRIDSLLSDVDHIEDRYRQDGIDWHTTQQGAPSFCSPLRRTSRPFFATAEDLLHAVSHDLLPALDALANEFLAVEQPFSQLNVDANTIMQISRRSFETDNSGARVAWHDFTGADPQDRTLRSQGSEWQGFRAWVRTLSETQRALQTGGRELEAHLNGIALNLLWVEDDEFEN